MSTTATKGTAFANKQDAIDFTRSYLFDWETAWHDGDASLNENEYDYEAIVAEAFDMVEGKYVLTAEAEELNPESHSGLYGSQFFDVARKYVLPQPQTAENFLAAISGFAAIK